jgi:choline/glycine/proline betaine transport protein
VVPALASVEAELVSHGVAASVVRQDDGVHIAIREADGERFQYGVRLRSYRMLTFAFVEPPAADERHRHWYAEAWCSIGVDLYDVLGLTSGQIIDDLLAHYSRWVSARTTPVTGSGQPH